MNPSSTGSRAKPWYSRPLPLIVIVVLISASIYGSMTMNDSGSNLDLVYYTAKTGDLPVTVTERGNLESQNTVLIKCEVDDIEGDGVRGAQIEWVIPNGSEVEAGDVVMELASSGYVERVDRQVLAADRAKSEQIQIEVKYENTKTQNQTTLAEAELQVELANLALEQFEDEEGGTFQLDLQDLESAIQNAQASKLIEQTNLEGVEKLYQLGYRSRGELAQARLSALRSGSTLSTAVARKKELTEYTYRKSKLELMGKVASAKRSLEQVKRDNDALLRQAKAMLDQSNDALRKENERLKRYESQREKCTIKAPVAGMIAYATGDHPWRRPDIRVGGSVYMNMAVLTMPNLKRMQVKATIHESVLGQVRQGLPATVRVDIDPDRSYRGRVETVAPLPDMEHLASSGSKVYATTIVIEEDVELIKPGMTAIAEIHVARLRDVVSVPVQAIVQLGQKSWVYVDRSGSPEKSAIKIGTSNSKFVEITEGVNDGDLVVLNPEALFDASAEEEEISPERGSEEPSMDVPDSIEKGSSKTRTLVNKPEKGAGASAVPTGADSKKPASPGGSRRRSGGGGSGGKRGGRRASP